MLGMAMGENCCVSIQFLFSTHWIFKLKVNKIIPDLPTKLIPPPRETGYEEAQQLCQCVEHTQPISRQVAERGREHICKQESPAQTVFNNEKYCPAMIMSGKHQFQFVLIYWLRRYPNTHRELRHQQQQQSLHTRSHLLFKK